MTPSNSMVLLAFILTVILLLILSARSNLKRAKSKISSDSPPAERITEMENVILSLAETPTYLRMTHSTFMSIDMSVEFNQAFFRMATLFYKGLHKESSNWRKGNDNSYSYYFDLNNRCAKLIDNIVPIIDSLQEDLVEMSSNKEKLTSLDISVTHEINLMNSISNQLEYGVPSTNETILEAIAKSLLGILFNMKEIENESVSDLKQELAIYDDLRYKLGNGDLTYRQMHDKLYSKNSLPESNEQ